MPLTFRKQTTIYTDLIENSHTKAMVIGGLEGWYNSTHFFLSEGHVKSCNGDLEMVSDGNSPWVPPVWNVSYIRHYFTRSEEEYAVKRDQRWRGVVNYSWDDYNAVNEYPPNVPRIQ